MKKIFSITFNSPIGIISLKGTEKGICKLSISKAHYRQDLYAETKNIQPLIRKSLKQLKEYFQGKRKAFTMPFDLLNGTEFEKKVWNALLEIPYGSTSTYKLIAIKIGKPKTCRAVGNAVGKNPIPVIIPCHRVIRKDKKLGGFSSGIEIKKKLLKLEKVKSAIIGL